MEDRYVRRFQLILDYANEMPEELFDMDFWYRKTACGSTCCVLGYAAQQPELIEEGLHLAWLGKISKVPQYGNSINFAAVAEFLDICEFEVMNLFGMDSYQRPTRVIDVINRIKEFLKTKGVTV